MSTAIIVPRSGDQHDSKLRPVMSTAAGRVRPSAAGATSWKMMIGLGVVAVVAVNALVFSSYSTYHAVEQVNRSRDPRDPLLAALSRYGRAGNSSSSNSSIVGGGASPSQRLAPAAAMSEQEAASLAYIKDFVLKVPSLVSSCSLFRCNNSTARRTPTAHIIRCMLRHVTLCKPQQLPHLPNDCSRYSNEELEWLANGLLSCFLLRGDACATLAGEGTCATLLDGKAQLQE